LLKPPIPTNHNPEPKLTLHTLHLRPTEYKTISLVMAGPLFPRDHRFTMDGDSFLLSFFFYWLYSHAMEEFQVLEYLSPCAWSDYSLLRVQDVTVDQTGTWSAALSWDPLRTRAWVNDQNGSANSLAFFDRVWGFSLRARTKNIFLVLLSFLLKNPQFVAFENKACFCFFLRPLTRCCPKNNNRFLFCFDLIIPNVPWEYKSIVFL